MDEGPRADVVARLTADSEKEFSLWGRAEEAWDAIVAGGVDEVRLGSNIRLMRK